jgi:hypothetical protein
LGEAADAEQLQKNTHQDITLLLKRVAHGAVGVEVRSAA